MYGHLGLTSGGENDQPVWFHFFFKNFLYSFLFISLYRQAYCCLLFLFIQFLTSSLFLLLLQWLLRTQPVYSLFISSRPSMLFFYILFIYLFKRVCAHTIPSFLASQQLIFLLLFSFVSSPTSLDWSLTISLTNRYFSSDQF